MYLFDNKETSIDIYDFKANANDLTTYRTEQMTKIPEDRRVYSALTKTDAFGDYPLFERYLGKTFRNEVLEAKNADNKRRYKKSLENGFSRYHILTSDGIKAKDKRSLIDDYCLGSFQDRRTVQIQYLNMMRYYLLISQEYRYLGECQGKNYKMDWILQIPESLYSLQLIGQGRFEALEDRDISEQLELYSCSPVGEVSKEEIKKMDQFGLTKDAYDKAVEKADNDSYVLKRIIKK